ncbi:CCT domain-containing protein [Cephalotus follicularis]|uniref:CCT domain-containing protein n=1 Tax=Cephalotus follicularis TaxID=3775 RepID=A0A1Q3C741_CEPFO|nr:CCT domain-containing protein [Cephalotus follicularis]
MGSNLFVFDDSFFSHSSPEMVSSDTTPDLHFFNDPDLFSLCDSITIDVLQEMTNNQNPVDDSPSLDQFAANILSFSPPSQLLENLNLDQTTQLHPLRTDSNLADGYHDFANLSGLEVKSEGCLVSFESGYNQCLLPHSYGAVENVAKHMQRSYSSNSFDAKPTFLFQPHFDTLMESPISTNQALSSPENGFLSSHMRRVCSTGDIQNIRTAQASQRSLSSPLATESSSMEEPNFKVIRYNAEERKQRILKYRAKRTQRNFNKTIKYACRKTLADNRPRIRGRFARNDETGEVTKPTCSTREEDDDQLWLEGFHEEEEERGTFVDGYGQSRFQYYGF